MSAVELAIEKIKGLKMAVQGGFRSSN